jgi:hypothetical protein
MIKTGKNNDFPLTRKREVRRILETFHFPELIDHKRKRRKAEKMGKPINVYF